MGPVAFRFAEYTVGLYTYSEGFLAVTNIIFAVRAAALSFLVWGSRATHSTLVTSSSFSSSARVRRLASAIKAVLRGCPVRTPSDYPKTIVALQGSATLLYVIVGIVMCVRRHSRSIGAHLLQLRLRWRYRQLASPR